VPITTVADDGTASEVERSRQWKDIGLGAQILRDLDISSIRLYASRSRSYVGLAGFGIEIASTESLEETGPRLIVNEPTRPRRVRG
jgi:3,4-dihydroxy 2-butanone 4-phosphate synthase/GTP cyclohydrolase II